MKKLLLLLLLCISVASAKDIVIRPDEHHIAVGARLSWHTPYDFNGSNPVGGGFTLMWDYVMEWRSFFTMGADFSTTWYGKTNNSTDYRISAAYRFGFHPFALPALKGEIPIANVLDPYVMLRAGLHFDSRKTGVVAPDISPITLGIRWYFNDNFALWGEIDSWYGFTTGIGFWF